MNVTARERVLTALSHREPDRVPFSWGFGPTGEMAGALTNHLAPLGYDWARLRAATDDILSFSAPYAGPRLPSGTDIWGIGRKSVDYGGGAYSEIERYPLAGVEAVAEVERYPFPSPDWFDFDSLRERMTAADPERRRAWKLTPAGNPFEIYCWMTGLEEAMTNLLTNPKVVIAAMERITDYFETWLNRALERVGDLVDLLFFADDLGSQTGLLMSRELYRQTIQPFHRRLIETGRRGAPQARAMFHTDGAAFDVVPDLLDAGIDVLEAVQTDAEGMEPARLKTAFGDRLSFHGGISVQNLLPFHDAPTVERECLRLVRGFGEGGGYIAAPSHAVQVGTPPENVLAMLRAVLGDDDYAAALDAAR